MAGALGNVPQNIKTGNYAGASSAIANPLLMGAMAGYSSELAGTGFVNELFNPGAGIGYNKPVTSRALNNSTSSVDGVIDLWRIQEKGARPMSELAAEGKLGKHFQNEKAIKHFKDREEHFGQWFTKDKNDFDFYKNDREFINPEILNLKVPKAELEKYTNYNKSLSRAPDREFVVPLEDQKRFLQSSSADDVGKGFKSEIVKNSLLNPIQITDKIIPRPLAPGHLLGMEDSWNNYSPLNLIPGYGSKLIDKSSSYPNFVGFRKFGNSIDDVIESQSLRPNGSGMGNSQIKREGNWAEPGRVNEHYSGVFEATMNPQVKGSDIKLEKWARRNGIVGTTKEGNVAIPLTDPGLSFNRRLPFSNRYVPIDKQKLINKEFQLATQLPHLQSLAEKYAIWSGLGLGAAYLGMPALHDANKKYIIDPAIEKYKKLNNRVTKPLNLPELEDGGFIPEQNPYDKFRYNTSDNTRFAQPQQKVLTKEEALKQSEAFKKTEAQRQKDLKNVIEEFTNISKNINPKNWGVEDYTNVGNFNKAYNSAKKEGKKEFIWNNKRYTTDYAGTPRQEAGAYLKNSKDLDLNYPVQVNLYNPSRNYLPGHISAQLTDYAINNPSVDYSSRGNYPFGISTRKSKDKKTFNVYGNIDKESFENKAFSLPFGEHGILLDLETKPSDWNLITNNCADNVCDAFSIPRSKGIQTPSGAMSKIKQKYPILDVTGRTYEDYNELAKKLITETHTNTLAGGSKKEYSLNKTPDEILRQSKSLLGLISSPELQKTRVSEIITMAIQKSLSEKGYKLPKSTKADGPFDGILGDETKQALLDYQLKNKINSGYIKMQQGGFVPQQNPYDKFRTNTTDNTQFIQPQQRVLTKEEALKQSEAFKRAEVQRQKDVKSKQDAEVIARMIGRADFNNAIQNPFTIDNLGVIGAELGNTFRAHPFEPDMFDDYINPGVQAGDMIGGLLRTPKDIREGDYGQVALNLAVPALTLAGARGARNVFGAVNEMFNPIAGIENFGKYISNNTALNTIPQAKNFREVIGTLKGIPTERSLPRLSQDELKAFRNVQQIGRMKDTNKLLNEQMRYALDINLPDAHFEKIFNYSKDEAKKFIEGLDDYSRINNNTQSIDLRRNNRFNTDNNNRNDVFREGLITPHFDEVSDAEPFLVEISGNEAIGIPNQIVSPSQTEDFDLSYLVNTSEENLTDRYSNIRIPRQPFRNTMYQTLSNDWNRYVDRKTPTSEIISNRLDRVVSNYPLYKGNIIENVPGLHLANTNSLKNVSEKVNYQSKKGVSSGDVFTGSLNTSHSSYLPQLKQVFKYTDGTPQFLGYKPMNMMGYLSNYDYSPDEIAKYLNTEIDEQISRGIIPKNIQRPYNLKNRDSVLLPQYGIKQFQSGGEAEFSFNMYRDYVNGVFDNTPKETEAKKIYDKLNNMYYRTAKENNTNPVNYIMTHLIGANKKVN